MNDVTTIQASQPDRAQQWRTALERCVQHSNFGRQIVEGQFDDQERYACLNGEAWSITSDFDVAIRAEVMLPLPMLNADTAWIYQEVLKEDSTTNSGIFARLWS